MISPPPVIPEVRRVRRQEPAPPSLTVRDDGDAGFRRHDDQGGPHTVRHSALRRHSGKSRNPPFFRTCFLAGVALSVMGMTAPAVADPYDVAVLQGLDKVTARVSTIEAPVGDTVRFGALEIIARSCDKRPPEETPESTAFLDIWEVRPGEAAVSLFRGWMFASSPALSAMEHPVYDVWLLDCKTPASADANAPAGGSR